MQRPHYLQVVTPIRLVLNLGHSPLYRHFCKCLYIEMLKIHLFIKYYILFLAMAKFKQACFAHDLSKKFHTFSRHGKVQASLLCS